VGINKTSLPSPGSNCCCEKNPHFKVSRKPFWFGCSLCPKCNRRRGGSTSVDGGDRGAHRPRLSSGVGCCPQGLGHHLADSWRKNRLESLVPDLGKTSGHNAEPCPGHLYGKNHFGTGGEAARQNLVPLSNPALCGRAGRGLLGPRPKSPPELTKACGGWSHTHRRPGGASTMTGS